MCLFNSYVDSGIPELKGGGSFDANTDKGPGSFGALNYASSFHHPCAIACDNSVLEVMSPTLIALGNDVGAKFLQLIPDRLCFRTKAQPIGKGFHYDATAGARDGDIFFGSIYNLNESLTQSFICVPGTHRLCADLKGGAYTTTDKNLQEEYRQREIKVLIPPGFALIFFENIIHRVSGVKPSSPILRKFVGFRLSTCGTPWMGEENARLIETQSPLHFKGGEIGRMFPRLYITNWVDKLVDFAEKTDSRGDTHAHILLRKAQGYERSRALCHMSLS